MHLRATRPPTPDAIRANVARLTALGLQVRISEMDVRIRTVRRGDRLARQGAAYRDVIGACVGQSGFAGVTFWGVSDRHSWVHERFGEDAPLLFDRDYAPKPAYFGARTALARAGRQNPTDQSMPSVHPVNAPDQK
jgi:endo-1,4-beta-xylanase